MLSINGTEHYKSEKIVSYAKAVKLIQHFKLGKKKIGLCHGAFDILHPGHIKHFQSAKKLCDILFVSITKDEFVSQRKGSHRPVYTDRLRAYAAASIGFVDYVVISNYKTAIEVIKVLKPDYYIKGSDFINKKTPGIEAEREAIKSVGGEIIYTTDQKFSTTELIDYIKNNLNRESILLILDRDGTLIENREFIGKNKNWRKEVKLKKEVIDFILFLQTKYSTAKIVVSNQAGVARKYFDCRTVEKINKYIDRLLSKKGIMIDNWQYCPYVDSNYAEGRKNEIIFDSKFVTDGTKRKPGTEMIYDGLQAISRKLSDFNSVTVLGDRDEDKELAKNLNARFVHVSGKSFVSLIKEFEPKNIYK